jgi:hypothetical protein
MFAYMIAEWRDWMNSHMAKTLVSGVVIGALIGAFVAVQPTIMMMALCLQSLWLGWYLGNRYWRGSTERSRVLYGGLTPVQTVAGKIGAAGLIAAVHACAMAPLLILTAAIWGIDAASIAVCILIFFGSFLTTLGFGFLFSLFLSGGEGFFGTLAVGIWLILTAVIVPARAANPFIQIWLCMVKSRPLSLYLCAPILFVLAGALFLVSVPLLKRLRMAPHE